MDASYFVESLLTNADKIKNLEGQIIDLKGQIIDLKKNMEKKDDLMNKNQELIESQNKRIIELSLSNKKLEISNKKLMERLEMKIDMLVKSEIEKKNLNQESTDADSDNE
jgi:chromosome segregation ATPase